MSNFTSFTWLRPQKPPRITTTELAAFVTAIRATGIVQDRALPCTVHVRYGRAIDRNAKPTSRFVSTYRNVGYYKDIRWSVNQQVAGAEIADLLAAREASIYRAWIDLGPLNASLYDTLHRQPDEQNQQSLTPDGLSLSLGPVECCDLRSERAWQLGWIALSLGGYGYLWPWTLRDWVARADAHPLIQAMQQACEAAWPLPPEPPTAEAIMNRAELGSLFPYEIDAPLGWRWSVHETG